LSIKIVMLSYYQIRVKGHFDAALAEWFAPL